MLTGLSIHEFHEQVLSSAKKYRPQCEVEALERNQFRLKARIPVDLWIFVDIFYAARTKRVSFAVICRGARVFGIDNLGGWHVHPLERNKEHCWIDEPDLDTVVLQCIEAAEAVAQEKQSR
jgi:hypothetical protein